MYNCVCRQYTVVWQRQMCLQWNWLYTLCRLPQDWLHGLSSDLQAYRSLGHRLGDVLIDLLNSGVSVHPYVLPYTRSFFRFGVWVDLDQICVPAWPLPDPRSRSRSFWSCENCTFLCLSPLPFLHGAQNWWLAMIVWDLVYSLSEPDFRISFQEGCHVSSNFVDCRYFIHEFKIAIIWYCVRLQPHGWACD